MAICNGDHTVLPPPPPGTCYVERQAGGHCSYNGDDILPNLQHEDGWFLKLLRDSPRYWNEVRFYRMIFDDDCRDKDILTLRQLVPKFDGVFCSVLHGKEINYLKLEDITRTYRSPCVLDVKMKADVHDPDSERTHVVSDLSIRMGFLLDGLQVYNVATGRYVSYKKSFGRSLTEEKMKKVLRQFVNGDKKSSRSVVDKFIERLRAIRQWACSQRKFTFYRSSLLMVYDADDKDDGAEADSAAADVRMVDFAKFRCSTEADQLYVRALDNLINTFRELWSRG